MKWVGRSREERLDAVYQRVHPCPGRQRWPQTQRQERVAERDRRERPGVEDHDLGMAARLRDGQPAAYFAAGPCSRGDRDQGRQAIGDGTRGVLTHVVGGERSRVAGEQGRSLPRVEDRAPTDGHDAVASAGAIQIQRGRHRLQLRVGRYAGIDRGGFGPDGRQHLSENAGSLDASVAHHERPGHAKRLQLARQRGKLSLAKENPGGTVIGPGRAHAGGNRQPVTTPAWPSALRWVRSHSSSRRSSCRSHAAVRNSARLLPRAPSRS